MEQLHFTEIKPVSLVREEGHFQACLGFSYLPSPELHNTKEQFLHEKEIALLKDMPAAKRQNSFLHGRYIAKKILTKYFNEPDPRRIFIKPGIFQQPIIEYPSFNLPQVSIAHTDCLAACLVFPLEHPMAIDIELISASAKEHIASQLTASEIKLFATAREDESSFYTRLWTIKEALSKVTKTGLMTPLAIYEIDYIDYFNNYTVSFFKNFSQYKAISFLKGGNICSIISPKNTSLNFSKI